MSLKKEKYKVEYTAQSVPKYVLLGYLLLVLTLSACSDTVMSRMDNYANRLERLAGEQQPPVALITAPEQPRVSEVRLQLPELSISLTDSFRLNQCRLGHLIAERNSSLGKVMTPAAQLYYEIDVTHALKECLAAPLDLSPRLRESLEQALTQKEGALKLAVHNFLTTDDVWRSSFRLSRNTLPLTEADDFTHTFTALRYFAHTLSLIVADPHHPEINLTQWHEQLETLGQAQFLSSYWRTLATVPAELDALTELLNKATNNIGCTNIARPQKAEYLHNVMLHIFIAKLQPAFARWVHYGQQLDPVIQQLTELTQGSTWPSYVQQLNQGKVQSLQRSTREHAEQWQVLLKKCRLSPTGASL